MRGAAKSSRLACKGLSVVCALASNTTPKGWIRRSVGAESISNLSGLGFSSVLFFIKDANVSAACVVWNSPKDSLDAPARKGAQLVPGAAHGVWSPSQESLHMH